jgi:hypothetical protein
MNTEISLKEYLGSHPDYWEFEDERKEVSRLEALIKNDKYAHCLNYNRTNNSKLNQTSGSLLSQKTYC